MELRIVSVFDSVVAGAVMLSSVKLVITSRRLTLPQRRYTKCISHHRKFAFCVPARPLILLANFMRSCRTPTAAADVSSNPSSETKYEIRKGTCCIRGKYGSPVANSAMGLCSRRQGKEATNAASNHQPDAYAQPSRRYAATGRGHWQNLFPTH